MLKLIKLIKTYPHTYDTVGDSIFEVISIFNFS